MFSALLKCSEDGNSNNLTPNLARNLGRRGFGVRSNGIGTKYSVKTRVPENYLNKQEKPEILRQTGGERHMHVFLGSLRFNLL